MEHNRIALIASLDTKLQETLYAKHEIESCGGQGLIIDISTKTLVDAGDAVGPADILARYGMTWEEFGPLDKAQSNRNHVKCPDRSHACFVCARVI